MTFLPWIKFFLVKVINITFIYLLALFIAILREDSDLWGCTIFGPKMVHLPQTRIFLEKINIILSTYWPLSLCRILKKFFQLIQSYEDVPSVLDPKWPICPNKIFFGKTIKVQKPCFWVIFDHFWSFLPNGDFFQKVQL